MTPLLSFLLQESKNKGFTTKEVAFADDFKRAGKINGIRLFWHTLVNIGTKFGYYPKPSKSYLIVKEGHSERANEIFGNLDIKVTAAGQRHLGSIIGSAE